VRLVRLTKLGAPLIALILLCAASALWSDLPLVALRRSAALAGTVTIGLYAALRFDIDELLELLCRVVAIVLVASFVLAALEPSLGLDTEGRLRGVFAHKNSFGIFAALGLLALSARALRRPSRDSAVFCALCAVGCLTGLVLSDSASPLPALVVGLAFMTWVHRSRANAGWLMPSLVAAACAAAIALPLFSDAFGVFALVVGRDADFSHRDLVWRFALELFSRNPWLGYGYEVFWNGPAGELFFRTAGFAVSHAHNGYLQLALDTGIVGLMAFLCALAMLMRRALPLLGAGYRPRVAWLVGFTAFYVVASAAESHAWKANDLLTVLFVYAAARTNVLSEDAHA
jgi:O-antigen ligase